MAVNAAQAQVKTVSDPCASYESLQLLWRRSRAVCRGEKYVKEFDQFLDTAYWSNLLIPFSPSMTAEQYKFFRAEAELPGITSQYAKTVIGGLLRKQPTINFPEDMDKEKAKEAASWIINEFGQDDSPLAAFLDEALWEEMQTSRAWILVDYPKVDDDELDDDLSKSVKPYPILYQAESIINWRTTTDATGRTVLDRLIIKGFQEEYDDDEYEFHPKLIPTVWVHELKNNLYQVRVYTRDAETVEVAVVHGDRQVNNNDKAIYTISETIIPLVNDERLDMIPAWPLNGCIEPTEPMLTPIIDKEIALYNKVARRNHLMYGAATYTPWVKTNMSEDEFDDLVDSGLGTWLKIGQEDEAGILETPVAALEYMETSIAAAIEEMAKLGIRMLSPETGDQSGVALELRNAAQTAQLGSLNNKVSNTLKQIIAFMVNWRYDLELDACDIDFTLSNDFNPMPVGADWLRLATEWYENGQIPRSLWLLILQKNDMIPPDYDDTEGQDEINDNELIVSSREQYEDSKVQAEAEMLAAEKETPVAKT
jgi:hypothetical protein